MRAKDLQISELVSQDPASGFPLLGSYRRIALGLSSLGRLHADLHKALGPEQAATVSIRYGYEAGLALATVASEMYRFDSPKEWLLASSVFINAIGMAHQELAGLELDAERHHLRFRGVWRQGFESLIWQENHPPSRQPVCFILSGVLSGYASAVLGSEVLVREISCQAQGERVCRFEGRSAELWEEGLRRMLKARRPEPLHQELKGLKERMRKAQQELERHRRELERLRRRRARRKKDHELQLLRVTMDRALQLAEKVAPTNSTVLILGESGTGKEVLARFIHRRSGRAQEPFMAINCAALPAQLLESELFGHVKGAFTGASRDKTGLFEAAGKGSVFLDEVGDMPLELQAKLLRALQEKLVRPVGAVENRPIHARIMAATNRDLQELMAQGRFREDLYYRLAVVPIQVPPLRERRRAIHSLARLFLARLKPNHPGFSPQALHIMEAHSWPGNIRELENCVEYASILAGDRLILPEHLPPALGRSPASLLDNLGAELPSLSELSRRYVRLVLEQTQGNKTQAARILGISPTTLWRWLKNGGQKD